MQKSFGKLSPFYFMKVPFKGASNLELSAFKFVSLSSVVWGSKLVVTFSDEILLVFENSNGSLAHLKQLLRDNISLYSANIRWQYFSLS